MYRWNLLKKEGLPESINSLLYQGAYPRIYDHHLNPTEALSFYYSTYVERDLRQLITVKDLNRFETFIKLCATRCGQILNMSSLGNDCGASHNTIKSWLSILEASYIIKLLRPFYSNLGKRLIKAPKALFHRYRTGCLSTRHPERRTSCRASASRFFV